MRFPPIDANAPSVLVVDEGFIGSLHTAIGLRRAGLRVVLLGAVGGRAEYRAHGFSALTGPQPGDARFVDAVDGMRRTHRCDLVYATTEPTMLALHDRIAPLHPQMTSQQRSLFADKHAMSAFAAMHEVPVPRALPVTDEAALARATDVLGLPLVLKTAYGRGGDGTRIVHSTDEAARFLARADAAGRSLCAQQLVRGRTYLAGGLFRDGEPLRFQAWLKVTQHPRLTGPAVRVRSVREETLTRPALAMMRALRWTGLASMDFVRDDATTFRFLEVNPRPWGSIAAAADAGLDLFTPLAQLLRGESPIGAREAAPGLETHVLPLYLLSRDYRRPWLPAQLGRDLRAEQAAPFRDAAFLRHVLYRLWRVRRNWRAV